MLHSLYSSLDAYKVSNVCWEESLTAFLLYVNANKYSLAIRGQKDGNFFGHLPGQESKQTKNT
jgi:hypothetical protein